MRVDLPPQARALAAAAHAAVDAARAHELDTFVEATNRLAGLDPDQVRAVLGIVVRALLEDAHPDGLDTDDARSVLARVLLKTPDWPIDTGTLVVVLAGALGVHERAEVEREVCALDVARHAPLVIVDLLGARPLEPYLARAFEEIARTETVEMP